MSKFPEYKHEKSQEWFNRALNAIPSGVYGHLGPSEGLFLPITKWPLMSQKAQGHLFLGCRRQQVFGLYVRLRPQCAGLLR